jgi:hypothetical protein
MEVQTQKQFRPKTSLLLKTEEGSVMNTNVRIHSQPRSKVQINLCKFDGNLLDSYASSLLRLLIFMAHCGPNHPCTENEVRLLRRYDSMIITKHIGINSNNDKTSVVSAVSNELMKMADEIILTFDLDSNFEEEIMSKFRKTIKNRFSIEKQIIEC